MRCPGCGGGGGPVLAGLDLDERCQLGLTGHPEPMRRNPDDTRLETDNDPAPPVAEVVQFAARG